MEMENDLADRGEREQSARNPAEWVACVALGGISWQTKKEKCRRMGAKKERY